MENNTKSNTVFKVDAKIHKIDNISEKKTVDTSKLNSKESFSYDGIKSYELKRCLSIKKEIIDIKKNFLQKFLILGALIFILIVVVVLFFIKDNNHPVANLTDIGIINQQIQKNSDLLKEQLKIIADNQKILNQKVIAVYNTETELMKEINSNITGIKSSIKDIQNYLKTEGKIIEVLSQIIMSDNIKLNKIIEKIYEPTESQIKYFKKSQKNNKESIKKKTPEMVKSEIKKETDNLISKYQSLLKELQ